MVRKLKYKDVVKNRISVRPKKLKKNNNKFKFDHKKTKTSFKGKISNKSKATEDAEKEELVDSKRQKVIAQLQESSESEEDFEDPLAKLQESFTGQQLVNAQESVVSESDSDSEVLCQNEALESLGDNDSDTNEISDINGNPGDEVNRFGLDTQAMEHENLGDPFIQHLNYELHPNLLELLESTPVFIDTQSLCWPRLGKINFEIPKFPSTGNNSNKALNTNAKYAIPPTLPKQVKSTANELFLKSQILQNIEKANKSKRENQSILTPLQEELFTMINNYQDVYFPVRTFDNAEEICFVYCLHVVNHILKTRIKILHHNAKLGNKEEVPEEYRDQGLVRPKILIILPFRDSALKVINTIIEILLSNDSGNVIKRNRFIEDFSGHELHFPKKNPKPADYEQLFSGNTDDNFKIGIAVTKKSLKLFADFYSSDIIIASPLGLRTVIGAEGEPARDFDFLTSIELLVLDQAEIFFMQNWDHLIHIFNHMHLKPKDLHGTDVSRVRQWSLNFWAKYYRQTLIFSSIAIPELNSIFNKKCFNYAGKARIINRIVSGSINGVFVQVPHVFHRFEANGPTDAVETRFNFFVKKILPQRKDSFMKQTLVFIPSYFDYVRVRNYFKKENLSFVQICEYSKENKVARARDMFYHGDAHFLLYTERYHFYNRIRIKGIRHLIFYQPPTMPHFYNEMCNLMQESNMNRKVGNVTNMSVTIMYSKYDIMQLSAVVGTDRAAQMALSERKLVMWKSGSDTKVSRGDPGLQALLDVYVNETSPKAHLCGCAVASGDPIEAWSEVAFWMYTMLACLVYGRGQKGTLEQELGYMAYMVLRQAYIHVCIEADMASRLTQDATAT
ncbi:U3 small nucleolar RNA-associated protein 25 homolog [Cylas formicarius]|uniref:U3 small nucleolar RNA-associated protein 25 homolog n=1 Tax=Cylas formicarius TaxID=197179 RepID=UPI00295882E0|nr:U3 small nucleolar RNA-associated protein 25 homolog [Cylas formicarius]